MDSDTFQVEVDVELKAVIPEFIESRKNECALIDRLLEEGKFKEIEGLGHRLKGTGGSYGFDAISDIGEALEQAAALHDRDSIARECRMLHRYLERVTVIYV